MKSLLSIIFSLIPMAMFSQDSYKVKVQKANVRMQPSTKSSIVGSLTIGTIVTVTSISNGWATITYNGKKCYVSSSLLEKEPARHNEESSKAPARHYNDQPLAQPSKPRGSNSSNVNSSRYYDSQYATSYNHNRKALWRFDASAMPQSGLPDYGYGSMVDLSAMLGGDIPLNIGDASLTLETGLRYLYRNVFLDKDDEMFSDVNYLEIPARLAYDIPLGDSNFNLRIGAGPYFSYMFSEESGLGVGIEPAISLNYKKIGLGLYYSVPFYTSYAGGGKSIAMINLSIRFGGKAWIGIGNTLMAIGNVSEAVVNSGLLGRNGQGGWIAGDSEMEEMQDEESGDGNILIAKEIARLQKEIGEMRHASIDYSGVIRLWEQKINWLREKQSKGMKYVSKEEYRKFKNKQREKQKKNSEESKERMKRQGERSKKVFEQRSNL